MSAPEKLHSPLAFTKAKIAFDAGQKNIANLSEKGGQKKPVLDSKTVSASRADPHVVTRGSGTGVNSSSESTTKPLSPYKPGVAEQSRWDWYQSTVAVADPSVSGLVDCLLKHWEFSDFVPAKNLNGYHYGGAIQRGGRVLCHLCWGGQAGVNCKTTSDESPVLAVALADFGVSHRPTRVDSCLDWQEEGLFDSLAAALIAFAQIGKGLSINQQGDWARGIARTLYIGSTTSPARLVLYEKGYEQGGDAPRDWVRLEARIRPNKEHRDEVSRWKPEHAFSASWIADASKYIMLDQLEKRAVGTVWKKSDDERARYALLNQYGPTLAKWAAEVGGWEVLGKALGVALDPALAEAARADRQLQA